MGQAIFPLQTAVAGLAEHFVAAEDCRHAHIEYDVKLVRESGVKLVSGIRIDLFWTRPLKKFFDSDFRYAI